MEKAFDLSRFTQAHRTYYETALEEVRRGRKTSHWMWFIFPQIRGLGFSETSLYYALESLDEARAFLRDPYLGGHLTEICEALLQLDTSDPTRIFGWPDDMKLRSCATIFSLAAGEGSVFHRVLERFFGGEPDGRTLALVKSTE